MGRIIAAVGLEPEAGDDGLGALAQAHERGVLHDSGPQNPHPAAMREMAHALQRERERLGLNVCERIPDLTESGAIDLADEAQREVHLLRALPARARQAAPQHLKPAADVFGQSEGDEEADHRVATLPSPSITLFRAMSAATCGTMRRTISATPAALGWMPSPWLSAGSMATPSRKNG